MKTARKQTADDIRTRLQAALRDRFAGDIWVRDWSPDESWVVFEHFDDDTTSGNFRVGFALDADGTVTLDDDDPEEVLVTTSYAPKSAELTGPIVRKDTAKQIVYGAVLVPGEPDADGEVLTATKIEEVAHTWLEDFRAIDAQHDVQVADASPVESYIQTDDRTVTIDGEDVTLPAGSWVMAAKVRDASLWGEIDDGTRNGFSVMGVPRASLEAAMKAVGSGDRAALKRVTLADVGGGDPNGDWVAPFVSIVDQPAVPKALFFAKKEAPKRPGLLSRLVGGRGAGKEGRRYSDSTLERLRTAADALGELVAEAEQERATKAPDNGDDMTPEEITQAVKTAVNEEIAPLAERLDQLEAAGKTTEEPPAGVDPDDENAETDDEAATKAQLAELVDRVEKVEKATEADSRQIGEGIDADETANKALEEDYDPYGRRRRA